jgi:hypothetical protein
VDALCILQDSSSEELSKQIHNMDSIYANAHFTIVAADSTSAHHGIHGVSIPRRLPESCNVYLPKKDSLDLCRTSLCVSSAHLLANCTKWATRAWTYQEALLSRRLLIFTKDICFLVCPTGVHREDMLEDDIVSQLVELNDYERLQFLRQDSPDFKDSAVLCKMITAFSSRLLTVPDAIIKAFGGIMTAVKEQYGDMRYGIPSKDINFALSWRYYDLDVHSTASRRQCYVGNVIQHPIGQKDGFPTWSWAGWLHDGAKVKFPGRKSTAKTLIYCVSNFENLEVVHGSNPNQSAEEKSALSSGQLSQGQTETSGSDQSPGGRETSGPSQPSEEESASKSCQRSTEESACISNLLSYPLTDDEKQDIWFKIVEFDLPLDSILIFKTHVLRISVDTIPTEIHGEWGIYAHNFSKGKRALYFGRNPLYDPFRSIIHVSRDWMDSTCGRLELAILGADTSDPRTLHLETIVLDRSGELCYRVSAVDLRFEVAEGVSTEETLARITEENALEIVILG